MAWQSSLFNECSHQSFKAESHSSNERRGRFTNLFRLCGNIECGRSLSSRTLPIVLGRSL
jgi:hypothetical protein